MGDGDPTPESIASVTDTALNGAQIASLMEVVSKVSTKEIPAATGIAINESAFPTLSQEQVGKIMGPLASFTPEGDPAFTRLSANLWQRSLMTN